jgi:hypothetical protein
MTKTTRKTATGLLMLAALVLGSRTLHAAPLIVTTGKVKGTAGKEVVVPIALKGVKDVKGVSCMSIRLSYDPALLTFKALDKGPALPNALYDKSIDETADPGKIGLGFVCGSKSPGGKDMASVEEDGVVLNVKFVVNEKATIDQKSPLKLDNYRALDSAEPPFELSVRTEDGEFAVGGPALPWMWILIGAGIAAFLLLVVIVLMRGKEKAKPDLAHAAPPGATVPPRFTPEGTTFAHTCTNCGGVIQLPSAMRGQNFQCGACGTTQVARS